MPINDTNTIAALTKALAFFHQQTDIYEYLRLSLIYIAYNQVDGLGFSG